MSDANSRLFIAILSASNFVIGMGAFVVIGLVEPISEDFAISTSQAGWIMTSYAIGYGLMSPPLVALTGHIGRRRVLAIGLALFALANLAAALAPGAQSLNAARFIAAAGAGIFTPVAATVAAGLSSPERQGRALAAVFFGLTLAQVLGIPAGSFIAYTFGWRLAFWIVVLLALPCIYLIWIRIPAGLSFQSVTLGDLARILKDPATMLAVLFTASFLAAIYVLLTYLAPLLSQSLGYGRNGITLVLLIFGAGAVIGNVLGGILADKLGPFRTLLLLASGQVLTLPAFSFLKPDIGPLYVAILVLIWSACGWSFMASQQVRLIAIAPGAMGVVLSLNAAAIYVGAAIGAAIGGGVLGAYGIHALGIAGSLVAIIAVLHIALSHRISGH